jgi:activator of Hsp90 ATPase-like protein
MGQHRTLVASFELGIGPRDAFALFTARGEQAWAEGWQPLFPAETPDDTVPGTVFLTEGDAGRSTWMVTDAERGRRIRYARVAAERTAGTVDVRLEEIAAGTRVTVTYDLTSLQPSADSGLASFAAGYPEYLQSWRTAIEQHLAARRRPDA